MKELNIVSLNSRSPYPVEKRTVCDYVFKTEFGVVCVVNFMDDYSVWEEGAYQLIIGNETHKKSPDDPKLRNYFSNGKNKTQKLLMIATFSLQKR